MLSGEGADELFGGYPSYIGAQVADVYVRQPRFVRGAIGAAVRAMPQSERKVPLRFLAQRFLSAVDLPGLERHREWTSSISSPVMGRLGIAVERSPEADAGAILDVVQRFDLEVTLAEGLLTKSDRGGMSSAIEIRSPFLDRDVLEFAASLRREDRVGRLMTKRFLKRYAERYLPGAIVHRRKRGLSVPLARWLRGPLEAWARKRLRAGRLAETGLDSASVLGLFDEHQAARADHARALWTLLVLDVWLEWASQLGREASRA